MSGPTHQDLRTVLDKYVEGATWAIAMASVGRKEKTAFSWLHKSQRAERLRQLDSPFFLKWNSDDDAADDPDEKADWYHNHLKSAGRARRTILFETILVNQAVHGVEEIIRDGNGKIVWQENPETVGKDDDQLRMDYGSTDRLLRDENGNPIPAVRTTQLPATLRQAILRGLMPTVYGDHQTVDVNTKSAVLVQHSFLKRPSSQQALPAPTDEAPTPQPERIESDLVRDLRQKLKTAMDHPNRASAKPNAPVHIEGRATGDRPDNVSAFPQDVPPTPDLRDHPRAYEVPKPAAPNYGRPSVEQQIDRPGLGSRSAVPVGGYRVR